MKYYDNHLHTKFSHDSEAEPEEIVASAIAKGLSGIAFTEHCDITYLFEEHKVMENLGKSIETAKRLNEKYAGQIEVNCGIEMSEAFCNDARTTAVLSAYANKIDALLCSVHLIQWKAHPEAMSHYDFSHFTHDEIITSLDMYFDEEMQLINYLDGDILCHITYPYRYINLVHSLNGYRYIDYLPQIKEILKTAAKKNMALEVNTSNVTKFSNGFYMADEYLLELFREYGGRLVTIGSDAHVPEHVGGSFDGAVQAIKKAGFSEYCYFKKREPVFVKID